MVTVGIATLPDRQVELKKTIASLYNQADRINVVLNGHERIPSFLNRDKIIVTRMNNERGDAEKFRDVGGDWYFSCDDDLIYPPDYVQKSIDKLNSYNRQIILTYHGRMLNGSNYFKGTIYHCLHQVKEDVFVDVGGTGVMAFHTSLISPQLSDFPEPNMADVWMGLLAKEKRVFILCGEHKKGWIKYPQSMKKKHTIYDDIDDEKGVRYLEILRD